MPTPCPGPCNTAWRRAEENFSATGTEHDLEPTWGQPAHCTGCFELTRQRLAELPRLLAAAHDEALHGTHTKTTGSTGHSAQPSWPGQTARLLIDRIVGEMAELQADVLTGNGTWGEDHEVGRGSTPNEPAVIAGIVATLIAHWDWAMQNHPAADESWSRDNANPGAQVSGWHRALCVFTKADEQRDVRRLAPCPRCHGPYLVESRDLRLIDDQPYIECRDPDCQRVLTRREYDAYVKALHAALIPAA